MSLVFNWIQQPPLLPIQNSVPIYPSLPCTHAPFSYHNAHYSQFQSHWRVQSFQRGVQSLQKVHCIEEDTYSEFKASLCDKEQNGLPHVQFLSKFPKEEFNGKVVMVRVHFSLSTEEALGYNISFRERSLLTIKYLYHAGAKVLIVSHWRGSKGMMRLPSTQTAADYLSSILQLKVMPTNWISDCTQSKLDNLNKADILLVENLSRFKEELANCSKFARKLSSGVDIFVNDTFFLSHKILASTVGVPRYCYASLAGFGFEETLSQMMGITVLTKRPYIAIDQASGAMIGSAKESGGLYYFEDPTYIGGDDLNAKAAAIHFLASKCDGLVFVGMMAFQIMHAKGLAVPLSFVDLGAVNNSVKIIEYAQKRNIPVLLPKDYWCVNDKLQKQLHTFPVPGILDGWEPVDLGPSSLTEISCLLSMCKKILWIGPVKFRLPNADSEGASKLAIMLETLSRNGCDVIAVGRAACKDISTLSTCTLFDNAAVVWEFLKGRVLPGLAALDRAYPSAIYWNSVFDDPSQPLVVDIGSGNGLFLFEMSRRKKDLNFLGLEINQKLVELCLASVHQSGVKNRYFFATNATSTFRSIVSSYPGELVLVSIQCPNPDFNKPEHRWRMLQRSLVEAIADLLADNGKVFLQSDVITVALRMREQFITYGKNKLAIMNHVDLKSDSDGWLIDNPYGVRSDWELHVIDRGDPMYRLMFTKVDDRN